MPSRRAHTKSRLGCVQCKARRVKCDQTYPTCNNCVRHEKTCVYAQVRAGASSNASKTTGTESPGATAAHHATPLVGPLFDSLDMMLMHHFCTATASSLSSSPGAQEVWRNVVPKYAHTHPLIMHGVLTLAAHHYVHVNKSVPGVAEPVTLHSYRTRALHHQQLGLEIYRHQVQNPGEDQSEILLTYAAVLGFLTFADAESEQKEMNFEDALNLFAVIRGKQALWRAGNGMSPTSNLAPAFFGLPSPDFRPDLSSTTAALGQLYDDANDDVRKMSIALLKSVTEDQNASEFRILGMWPAGMSNDFLRLLELRDGVALKVFEHYCTILDSMRHLWWMSDFGQKMRAAIREVQSPAHVQLENESRGPPQDGDTEMGADASQ